MTLFYTYRQNNSGGSFKIDPDRGISIFVVIEAAAAPAADRRAVGLGIYFNGVYRDMDCRCCGDRWNEAWEIDGHDVPSFYGIPIEGSYAPVGWAMDNPEGFIHYKGGRMEAVWVKDSQYEVTPWPLIAGEVVTDVPEIASVS